MTDPRVNDPNAGYFMVREYWILSVHRGDEEIYERAFESDRAASGAAGLWAKEVATLHEAGVGGDLHVMVRSVRGRPPPTIFFSEEELSAVEAEIEKRAGELRKA